jgi:uncharacterized phage protein (TIGR02218 family)
MGNAGFHEIAIETNRPIELFEFTAGTTTTRYTSSEGEVPFNGFTWLPRTIERSSYGKHVESEATTLDIKLPSTDVIASRYIGIQPADRLDVVVSRIHETMSPETAILLFRGYVTSAAFKDEVCKLILKPFNEIFQRQMPRQTYQGLCNHVHYDGRCGILETASPNQLTGTVISQTNNGEVINVAGAGAVADNKSPLQAFKGGFVRTQDSSDFRMILDQNGDDLTLLLPFSTSVLGATVVLQRGCDRSIATCAAKYSNVINYGGFPHVPGINPFRQGTFVAPASSGSAGGSGSTRSFSAN